MKQLSFSIKTIIWTIFICFVFSAKAQTSLPVAIDKNTGNGNISSLSWVTFNNSNPVWETTSGHDYGYQLNQATGSMVFSFSDVPTNAIIKIHRYRTFSGVGASFPQVIIEASPDNSTWHQIGNIATDAPAGLTLYDDKTINVSFLSSDRFLRIRRVANSHYAYLHYLFIDGYTPTEAEITFPANSNPYTLNFPCFTTDVKAALWAAGGGGGHAYNSCGSTAIAGGGGGGAYAIKNFGGGGGTMSVKIGSGGAGATSSKTDGGNGQASTCTYNSISITANGGNGGGWAYYGCSGIGGSTSSGAGGAGGTYSNNSDVGSSNGNNGGAGNAGAYGGGAGNGGGNTVNNTTNNSNGIGGTTPGGGGSGARRGGGSSVGNNNGGDGRAGSAKITFDIAVPNITITNNNSLTFCEGSNTTLSASTCADAYITYQWYKDGVALGGETNSSITVSETGDYYVFATLSITLTQLRTIIGSNLLNLPGSVNSLTRIKFSDIISVTVAQATDTTINATICEGQTYTGNGFSNISTEGLHTRVTGRNAAGCDSIVRINLTINAAPTVNLLSDEVCEHTPGELIQIEFTGQPNFTLNYTVDIAGVGNGIDPVTLGLPTVFGNGQPGVATWTGSNTNWSAGIATVIPGLFTFNVIEITDGNGCQSTRP
jgi:hypothetical protein